MIVALPSVILPTVVAFSAVSSYLCSIIDKTCRKCGAFVASVVSIACIAVWAVTVSVIAIGAVAAYTVLVVGGSILFIVDIVRKRVGTCD